MSGFSAQSIRPLVSFSFAPAFAPDGPATSAAVVVPGAPFDLDDPQGSEADLFSLICSAVSSLARIQGTPVEVLLGDVLENFEAR